MAQKINGVGSSHPVDSLKQILAWYKLDCVEGDHPASRGLARVVVDQHKLLADVGGIEVIRSQTHPLTAVPVLVDNTVVTLPVV